MNQTCRICKNIDGNRLHTAREMAFGLREKFTYLECGRCGCVQLLDIPADIGKYYPPNYYSFQEHGKLKTFLRHQWSELAFGQKNLLGWFLAYFFFPNRAMESVRRVNVSKTARILDVGCGSGRLLQDLAYLGFKDLSGADPFIAHDLVYESGVRVFKKNLNELSGDFDLIMLHYSYEHMDHPAEVMQQIQRLLKPGGQSVIRIPVATSYAWRHYGVNWVNMDPPRHFFIHTFQSMEILAQQFRLKIVDIFQEGGDEQFWGSEQYEQDIPSNDSRSLYNSPLKRLLAWPRIRACKAKAKECNRKNEGDLVCFQLLKPKS